MAFKTGVILSTYDTWEPILQVCPLHSNPYIGSTKVIKGASWKSDQTNISAFKHQSLFWGHVERRFRYSRNYHVFKSIKNSHKTKPTDPGNSKLQAPALFDTEVFVGRTDRGPWVRPSSASTQQLALFGVPCCSLSHWFGGMAVSQAFFPHSFGSRTCPPPSGRTT